MKNFNLLKLLKIFNSKSSNQGFTLTELLVALVMTSVILAVAAQGTASLFQSENRSNAKNTRRVELTRALAYMQNEINSAVSVQVETSGCSSGTGISSTCLRINTNAAGTTYVRYAFQDISSGAQTWLKPGVLRREVGAVVNTSSSTNVLVDGLAIAGFSPAVPTNCPGLNTTFYGTGGFRFCLGSETAPIKRVQIFLYGYTGPSATNPPIKLDMLTFAKSN